MAPPRCLSQASLKDKTAIVTGANTGIGLEVAKDLARRGAKLILACRNETRAEAAVAQIVKDTGNENVVTLKLDLASLSSVREFAQKVTEGEARLDILVNNAAVCPPKSTTEDGFEMHFGVNHLGHFLLTNLLLDLLKKSAPSRVVVVSSDAHFYTTTDLGINFEDINSEKSYVAFAAYAQSKLANILFTRELAKRLEGTGVTTYAAHPGHVKTEIWRHLPERYGWKFTIFKPVFNLMMSAFFRTPEQGAQTVIHCAVEETLSSESGLYYSDCDVKEPSQKAMDDAVARQLWESDQPADASASAATLPTSNACTPAGPMHLATPVYPWWQYQHVQIGTLFKDRVFVRGFDPDCSEQELREFFSQFGAVRDTKIIADRAGVSKGYGFVTFDSQEAADKAQQNDNLMFKDKRLNVGPAIRKQAPSLPSPFRPESSCSPYLVDIGPSSQSFVNNWSLPYGYMCPDSYLPQQTIVGPSVPPSLSPAPIMLPAGPPAHQPCNMYLPQGQPHQSYYPNTAAGQQYSTNGREWAPQSPPAAMQAPQPTFDGYGPIYQEMVPVEMSSFPPGCVVMTAPNLPPEASGYISMSSVPIMQQVQEVNPPPEQPPPPPVYTQHSRRHTAFHGPPPARRFARVGTGRPRTLPARPVMEAGKSAPQEGQPVPTLTPPPTPTPSINN